MPDTPCIQSLPEQTARILKQRILDRQYQGTIPGEPALAKDLQISRSTLRKALSQLTADKILSPPQAGKPRKIALHFSFQTAKTSTIGIITPKDHDKLHASLQNLLRSLRKKLEGIGIICTFHTVPFQHATNLNRLMEKLVTEQRKDLWIVYEITNKLAHWLFKKNILAIACGGDCPPNTILNAGYDHGATTRHALPILFHKGHDRIIHFFPHNTTGLIRVTNRLFLQLGKKFDPKFHVQRHDGTKENMIRLLTKAFKNAAPPTAFITTSPWQLITLTTWLATREFNVGKDISIINIGSDPVLEFISPKISYYTTKPETLANALSRLAKKLLAGQSGENKYLVMDYIEGNSIHKVSGK